MSKAVDRCYEIAEEEGYQVETDNYGQIILYTNLKRNGPCCPDCDMETPDPECGTCEGNGYIDDTPYISRWRTESREIEQVILKVPHAELSQAIGSLNDDEWVIKEIGTSDNPCTIIAEKIINENSFSEEDE